MDAREGQSRVRRLEAAREHLVEAALVGVALLVPHAPRHGEELVGPRIAVGASQVVSLRARDGRVQVDVELPAEPVAGEPLERGRELGRVHRRGHAGMEPGHDAQVTALPEQPGRDHQRLLARRVERHQRAAEGGDLRGPADLREVVERPEGARPRIGDERGQRAPRTGPPVAPVPAPGVAPVAPGRHGDQEVRVPAHHAPTPADRAARRPRASSRGSGATHASRSTSASRKPCTSRKSFWTRSRSSRSRDRSGWSEWWKSPR